MESLLMSSRQEASALIQRLATLAPTEEMVWVERSIRTVVVVPVARLNRAGRAAPLVQAVPVDAAKAIPVDRAIRVIQTALAVPVRPAVQPVQLSRAIPVNRVIRGDRAIVKGTAVRVLVTAPTPVTALARTMLLEPPVGMAPIIRDRVVPASAAPETKDTGTVGQVSTTAPTPVTAPARTMLRGHRVETEPIIRIPLIIEVLKARSSAPSF
jgi:hypothetical protein